MMIIESSLQGKYNDASRCEDALFISDDGVAVIDGATAKAHTVRHQTTPGKMAAQRIKAALHDCIGSADPFALLRTLNNAVAQLPFDPPLSRPTASVIIYQRRFSRIVNYGDCQCIIDHVRHLHEKAVNLANASRRRRVLRTCLHLGISRSWLMEHDPGRIFILPALRRQHRYANNARSKLGYGVIDGQRLIYRFMTVYQVHAGNEIILASDGYPMLQETLQPSEQILQWIHAKDALIIGRPYGSTKGLIPGNVSYDDRTYIRFIA